MKWHYFLKEGMTFFNYDIFNNFLVDNASVYCLRIMPRTKHKKKHYYYEEKYKEIV